MLIGLVKVKFVAVLLGPDGVGLLGVFNNLVMLVQSCVGLGLNNSGVRQIADANTSGDQKKIAVTLGSYRRLVLITGILGMILVGAFCVPLSKLSFGTPKYALMIAFLGISIFLSVIASGQTCLLQGMRRIREIAIVNVLGTLIATAMAIPCYYFWGLKGIVPSLILLSAGNLLVTWYFARKIPIPKEKLMLSDFKREAFSLIRLGVCFMASGVLGMASAYFIKIILIREADLVVSGYYQAAFNLSGVLIGFILTAMGTDYYPRLVEKIKSREEVNREVNEQSEIAYLLGFPGVLFMVVFAPLAIHVVYSASFTAAILPLQLFMLGVWGRIITWPVGFVLLAYNAGGWFLFMECLGALLQVGLCWLGLSLWGLNGAAVGFGGMYALWGVVLFILIFWKYRVRLNNIQLFWGIFLGGILLFSLCLPWMVGNFWIQWGIQLSLLAGACLLCLRQLQKRLHFSLVELKQKIFKPSQNG